MYRDRLQAPCAHTCREQGKPWQQGGGGQEASMHRASLAQVMVHSPAGQSQHEHQYSKAALKAQDAARGSCHLEPGLQPPGLLHPALSGTRQTTHPRWAQDWLAFQETEQLV